MEKLPLDYVRQEYKFCKQEDDLYYKKPTEKNRMLVLSKRKEFKNRNLYIPPNS